MDINRTGPRNSPLENPTQKTEHNSSGFKNSADEARGSDPGVAARAAAGVTRGDLADAGKAEEILKRYFSDMVESASRELGVCVSDTQKQNLVQFLGNDPVIRGKLLNYLEQSISNKA